MTESMSQEITVHGEVCTVVAVKKGRKWRASGNVGTKHVRSEAASSASQAFAWWREKAEMREWD